MSAESNHESTAESSDHSAPASDEHKYAVKPSDTDGMPGGIPYIIGNEAAERFSFYGMKCILVIFMTDYLHWMGSSEGLSMSKATAIRHYHDFTAAAYFFPIFGALLSDIFLGKYRTILSLSIVYCIGHAALAFMGTPPIEASWWLAIGLTLIAIGSGGIKPCVSAHVGDQFGERNKHLLTKVYQWFYFSINFGSFISTLLTPWMLQKFGPHWAFGIPGVLMALATLMFWMGRNKFVHIPAGGASFIRETFSPTGILAIAKLMCIFVFVAVFWALFDQTGSSWVLQAKSLNKTWLGFTWLESQIQAINPILVLALIPVFQFGIYPAIDKVFKLTPIRKISLGLFVMTGGFAIVSMLQQAIDAGAEPSIGWQFLAYAVLTASEVMVSITCLEFAYTQAPKTMKSAVMAVFLFSVTLGNVFTSQVNRYIETPAVNAFVGGLKFSKLKVGEEVSNKHFAGVKKDDTTFVVLGPDGKEGTSDDVIVTFNEENGVDKVTSECEPSLQDAAEKISTAFFANNQTLPSTEDGAAILDGITDAYGNPIQYRTTSRDTYQLDSAGADKEEATAWDQILTGTISRVANSTESEQDPNAFSWLERKQIRVRGGGDANKTEEVMEELRAARGGGKETKISTDYAVGGKLLLDGAAYFWFWTKCIFVTSLLFIPVGFFYREKTYIQGDHDIEGAPREEVQAEAEH
ncbi:MAG: MFS transporter [Rhodopirellula sp. TMED11]|nr:MAG: MFS transporter [Rhodopirellula sp. TMED11]